MSLTTLPRRTADRPGSRAARLSALAAPGALLLLCTAAAASLATSQPAIVEAVHLLVASR